MEIYKYMTESKTSDSPLDSNTVIFPSVTELLTRFLPLAISIFLLRGSVQQFSGSQTLHSHPADKATVSHVKRAETAKSVIKAVKCEGTKERNNPKTSPGGRIHRG